MRQGLEHDYLLHRDNNIDNLLDLLYTPKNITFNIFYMNSALRARISHAKRNTKKGKEIAKNIKLWKKKAMKKGKK